MKDNKGFTLVELLAVIVIIGILATIGTITVTKIIASSENKALVEEGINLAAAGKYAYENNDSLNNANKVCISLETLYQTGYYEKGKEDDYSGSVLIENKDGKITTTFWLNKENSKYLENVGLKVDEKDVKKSGLKYDNSKEDLNNGSFCGFKSEADKTGVNVGTKENLDDYTGKTPIEINVQTGNVSIPDNITNLNCQTDSGKKENCITQPTPAEETVDPSTIPTTGDNPNNYLVFQNDKDQNLFRLLETVEIEACNVGYSTTGECLNYPTNYKKMKLIKIVQVNFASYKQISGSYSKVTEKICHIGENKRSGSTCALNLDQDDITNKFIMGNQGETDFLNPLNDWKNGSYIWYLSGKGVKVTNPYIPFISWHQKRYYRDNSYQHAGTQYDQVNYDTTFLTQMSILSEDDFVSSYEDNVATSNFIRPWLVKNANELLMDLGRCTTRSCGGAKYIINGTIRPDYHQESNSTDDTYPGIGYIRPVFYLTLDKNSLHQAAGVASYLVGTKSSPYIIVQS